MSEFLQQLRANAEKRNHKRRRHYDKNHQNLVYDRRNTGEPRRSAQRSASNPEAASAITIETMSAIRDLLTGLSASQDRMAAAEERKATAMEDMADALHRIAENSLPQRGAAALHHPEMVKLAKRQAKLESDPNRRRVMEVISEMREKNATYHEIAARLDEEGLKTFSGRGKWHAQTVHRLCQE
jgi:uncharacterized protein with von Willebrand factor type A (vWA) domain